MSGCCSSCAQTVNRRHFVDGSWRVFNGQSTANGGYSDGIRRLVAISLESGSIPMSDGQPCGLSAILSPGPQPDGDLLPVVGHRWGGGVRFDATVHGASWGTTQHVATRHPGGGDGTARLQTQHSVAEQHRTSPRNPPLVLLPTHCGQTRGSVQRTHCSLWQPPVYELRTPALH